MKYRVLESPLGASLDVLSAKVEGMSADGWKLCGYPFAEGGKIYQAMTWSEEFAPKTTHEWDEHAIKPKKSKSVNQVEA